MRTPVPPSRARRGLTRLAAVGLTAALTLGLAACGDDDDESTAPAAAPSASSGTGAEQAAYPVTITHKLGTTTIKEAPKRIVALGEVDQDVAIALGAQLTGMIATTGPDGIAPWVQGKLTGTKPEIIQLPDDGGPSVEKVLSLKPDLILGGSDFWIEQKYEQLSKIAPTTAYETGPSQDTWQQITRLVAKALGRPADGEKLVQQIEAQIAGVPAKFPDVKGRSFALTASQAAGSVLVLKDPNDTAVSLLKSFGMTFPDRIGALPGESFAAELSMERLDVIDVDVLLSGYQGDAALQKAIESNPQFAKLNVVTRGSYLALDSNEFWALRAPTPLTIGYVLDQVMPRIQAAAAKAPKA